MAGKIETKRMFQPSGTLRGGRDSITITFPAGTGLPSYTSRSGIEVQGEALDTGSITLAGRSLTFTLPSAVYVSPGKWVNVKIKAAAGIQNPASPGSYNLSLKTSADSIPVNSGDYKIAGQKAITLVIDSSTAFIDGRPVSLDVPAAIHQDRTLVPIRFVAESLGARVDWDEPEREVTVYLDGKTLKLTIGSHEASVNGLREVLDTTPIIVGDRTLVPIRFIAENFGGQVEWDNSTRTVLIKK